jgi:hypothetical protein
LAPEDTKSKEYKKWQERFLSRFADPTNQASVAYSLRNVIPELPESVVKYVLYREESGDRREDFVLNISAMDLLALVDAISPLLNARAAELEGKPLTKTLDLSSKTLGLSAAARLKGFGSTSMEELKALEKADMEKLKAQDVAQQRAALQAQLAELETASEG